MTNTATRARQIQMAQKPMILRGFTMMDTARFVIRTMDDAYNLSRFASEIFPDAERVQPGLYELFLNAIEHGCLGMGYEMKSKLIDSGMWKAEVLRRQTLPENRKKIAEVLLARRAEGIFAIINDPGPGFDWKSWLGVDPARAGENHGRGIARARSMSFDGLTYNAKGSQAVAHVKYGPEMQW